jgi:outer membrane protein
MKKLLSSITLATLLSTSANAFIGLDAEVGVGVWAPEMSGDITYNGNTQYDLKNLGLDDKSFSGNSYLYADFSHFVPLIPNARVEKLQYEIEGTTNTNISLDQTDIIAYWGIPMIPTATAGILEINFGLDIKNIKGDITIGNDDVSFDESLPLAYLNTRIDLPFAPINIEGTIKTISYDGSSINDNEIKISGVLDMALIDLKLDLGYRQQNITIVDSLVDDFESDVSAEGLFFGVSAKF